tara:strand:- start:603 stop:821 length:219 start_codon:yes stop_codon:yes gene_type:complete
VPAGGKKEILKLVLASRNLLLPLLFFPPQTPKKILLPTQDFSIQVVNYRHLIPVVVSQEENSNYRQNVSSSR